jgi:hypothetical protein
MPSDDLKTLQEQLLRCWVEVGTTQDPLRLFNLMTVIHDLEDRIGRLSGQLQTVTDM